MWFRIEKSKVTFSANTDFKASEKMPDQNVMLMIDHIAHEVLMWIGFGTVVGLSAKALMPGRDPGGAVGTMLMGVVGSLIGCSLLLLIDSSFKVTPISPIGFVAGTAGAFLLLFFFRLLSNSYMVEAVDGKVSGNPGTTVTTFYRRRNRRAA
jgi:uncharacterized membrane protein YeaQ/YmgE (transglycosylase-associated protein family)